jgi:hypothetical protein
MGDLAGIEVATLKARIEALEAERDDLRYRLEEIVGGHDDGLAAFGLGFAQRRILGAMLHRPGVPLSCDQLNAAARWLPNQDWPDRECIRTHICLLRKRLSGSGITIRTHWGGGYSAIREPAHVEA